MVSLPTGKQGFLIWGKRADTHGMKPPWNVALIMLVQVSKQEQQVKTHIKYRQARKDARPFRKN